MRCFKANPRMNPWVPTLSGAPSPSGVTLRGKHPGTGSGFRTEPRGPCSVSQASRLVCFVFLNLLTVLVEGLQPGNGTEYTVALLPTLSQPHSYPSAGEWGHVVSIRLRRKRKARAENTRGFLTPNTASEGPQGRPVSATQGLPSPCPRPITWSPPRWSLNPSPIPRASGTSAPDPGLHPSPSRRITFLITFPRLYFHTHHFLSRPLSLTNI